MGRWVSIWLNTELELKLERVRRKRMARLGREVSLAEIIKSYVVEGLRKEDGSEG